MSRVPRRYQARPTGHRDRLGLPYYEVIDTKHGYPEQVWSGYFAGLDAEAAAARLNGEPEEDHD